MAAKHLLVVWSIYIIKERKIIRSKKYLYASTGTSYIRIGYHYVFKHILVAFALGGRECVE